MFFTLDIEALYYSHQHLLTGHLTKIVNCKEVAAELTQESYLILSQTAKSQVIENPGAFLFQTATNLAFNHLRHRKVTDDYTQHKINTITEHTPSTEHVFSKQQSLEQFCQIIDELPPRCRDVFILYKIHGMSYKEIAAELGISVSGVEKHIMKGLSHVRQKLLINLD
jgi:RNA polymerase sigma-70 factor (ECF subfamily)